MYEPESFLFPGLVGNKMEQFFNVSDQYSGTRTLVRSVVPIKSEGKFYSFVHKTFLEISVANTIKLQVLKIFKDIHMTPSDLRMVLHHMQSLLLRAHCTAQIFSRSVDRRILGVDFIHITKNE